MIELYQAEGCPYSQTVRETLTDLVVSFVAHSPRLHGVEVRNEQTHQALVEIGGQDHIRVSVDHHRGLSIYESDDIVEYLQEHYT